MEVRDLPPAKDPKGGASSPTGTEKKPKSDQIRAATVGDFIKAHSHGNGGPPFAGFLKSNLFAALMIWILSQLALFAGTYFLNYARTNQLMEWRIVTDQTLKRMDDWGTVHGHYADERQDAQIIELQSKSKNLTDIETQLGQVLLMQSERNNQQDKDLSALQGQVTLLVPAMESIKAKLNFVADLLDERTKNQKR